MVSQQTICTCGRLLYAIRMYTIFCRCRAATVREKYLENEIFSRSGKSWNFVDGQGNLERTWKVREKSGNLKIWQVVFRKFIYSVQEGKGCTFS